jgi:hypothetical protein
MPNEIPKRKVITCSKCGQEITTSNFSISVLLTNKICVEYLWKDADSALPL